MPPPLTTTTGVHTSPYPSPTAKESSSQEGRDIQHERRKHMAWSAENATKAYLQTLKAGGNGVTAAEFISAMAAGRGARLMVEASGSCAGPTTLALAAAALHTGGRVVCIVPIREGLRRSRLALMGDGGCEERIELVVGDARSLLPRDYQEAEFLLVDCRMQVHEEVFAAAANLGAGGVVGYNVLGVGEGITVRRGTNTRIKRSKRRRSRSQWVVRVDECTGEEHVFRVTPATSSPSAHSRSVLV